MVESEPGASSVRVQLYAPLTNVPFVATGEIRLSAV